MVRFIVNLFLAFGGWVRQPCAEFLVDKVHLNPFGSNEYFGELAARRTRLLPAIVRDAVVCLISASSSSRAPSVGLFGRKTASSITEAQGMVIWILFGGSISTN